jgi:hypothetical protein
MTIHIKVLQIQFKDQVRLQVVLLGLVLLVLLELLGQVLLQVLQVQLEQEEDKFLLILQSPKA